MKQFTKTSLLILKSKLLCKYILFRENLVLLPICKVNYIKMYSSTPFSCCIDFFISFRNSTSDRYIDPSVGVSQLHEYVPATELKGSDDYVLESKHYSYYAADSDLDVTILKEDRLYFPDNLLLYSFEPGNVTAFPGPRRGTTGVSSNTMSLFLVNNSKRLVSRQESKKSCFSILILSVCTIVTSIVI